MFERNEHSHLLRSPYSEHDSSSWSISKIAVLENLPGSNVKRRLSSSKGKRFSFTSSRKFRDHSSSAFLKKLFLLGLVVLIPLYLPYLLVQLQLPSLIRPVNSTQSQFVLSSQSNSNQKRNYQDRKNFMNIASAKAGARIYELNCYDPEKAPSNFIADKRQRSIANCSKCKDLKPLIDEKNSENWSYLEQKGSLYLEFREAARIYALGLEFYRWEAKWFISNQGRFVVKGIKLTSNNRAEESWEEADLIEIEIGGYDEIEELDEKIKLYYDCKISQCYEKYQAIVLELHNPNPNNLKNNIEKIFVFERF